MSSVGPDYGEMLRRLHRELGIAPDYGADRGLTIHSEPAPANLVTVATTVNGRAIQLVAPAATAWHRMARAAADDSVELVPLSGYRSVARQADIMRAHLAHGRPLADLLASVAAPGYSEHHSGRALDLGVSESDDLSEAFGETPAFAWLSAHAATYGFHLSYPRGNPHGLVYEPWHWCWRDVGLDLGPCLTPQ